MVQGTAVLLANIKQEKAKYEKAKDENVTDNAVFVNVKDEPGTEHP